MKINRSLIKDLAIPVLTIAIGTFIASWLLIQYQQPQIVYYTDGYYQKVNDASVGSIFVVNEGRSPETNLSIFINEKIPSSSIRVAYLSMDPIVISEGIETQIVIPKLKPYESADIVFTSIAENMTFEIGDITSDSGNIRHEEWVRPWWYLTPLQWGILVFAVTIAFGAGFAIGLIKNDLITQRTSPKSGIWIKS